MALAARIVLADGADAHEYEYPAEDFEVTSYLAVGAGFALVASILLLGAMIYCGRGERDGRPDLFGQTVTIRQIEAAYRTTWAPSGFFPSMVNHNDSKGSIVYAVVWIFLLVWLFMTGVFLVIAGAAETIEVYRQEALLRATLCVCGALVVCGLWIIVFRTGSFTPTEKKEICALEREFRVNAKANKDFKAPEVTGVYECDDSRKKVFLEIATLMLLLAWVLVLVATAQTQAWTLPGDQYGMLIFVAPGYGLLAGWLLYATSINLGVAYCARSCPDTVRPPPADANDFTYRGSVWPIVVATVLLICAVAIPDPTQPVPFVISVLLFTPRYRENLVAVALALGGIALGTWRVWALRSEA